MASSFEEFKQAADSDQGLSEFEKFKRSAEDPGFFEDLGKGAYAGLLNASAPLGWLAEPLVPGEQDIVYGDAPDSLPGAIGNLGTQAAIFGATGGVSAAAAKAPPAVAGAKNAVQNFLSSVGVNFSRSPSRFVAAEAGMGATAGAGGFAATQIAPDSEGARFVGEILGGAGPGMAAAAGRGAASGAYRAARSTPLAGRAIKAGESAARTAKQLSAPQTRLNRASERIGRATSDVQGAAQRMDEELLPGLTPAARTGDRGLLALETSANKELDDAEKFLEDSIQTVNQNIKNAINDFGQGSPEQTARTFESAQQTLRQSLDDRLKLAAQRTEQTLADIAPGANRETVNRIAANELRSAMDAARAQERKLYDLIPEDAVVPTNNTQQTFRDLKASLSQAEIEDLPAPAKRFLDNKSSEQFGAQTTIKEIRGLQSKLRQVSRNARSGDKTNLNQARMADMLSDAITDDLSNAQGGEEVADLVQSAVNYSREMNQKFRKGTVGNLLGLAKQAEPKVPEGLVLEKSIGLSGPNAREAFDDIVRATDSPEVQQAMDQFIKNKFFDHAVIEGQFNRERAADFVRRNSDILGRMPQTGRQLQRAIEADDVRGLRQRQRDRVDFQRPSVSKATMFIEKGPEKAFRNVLDARTPSKEMHNLVNMARRDQTGEAEQGLKAAFSQFIEKQATTGDNISGQKLNDFLSNPKVKSAMRGLYTAPEIRRWELIGNTAKRLDLQRGAKEASEGVLGDAPGQYTTMLARVLGAISGRRIGRAMGSGGTVQIPGIFSDRAAKLLQKGIDPSRQLLIDAVQDEKLFKELLQAKITPEGDLPKQAKRRLNAWLATLEGDEEQ